MKHPLTTKLADELSAGDGPAAAKTLAKIDRRLVKPELWGVTEVAEYLGIGDYQNVYKLADLPEPAIKRNRGRLWDADVIRAYKRSGKVSYKGFKSSAAAARTG